ncbi:MAG: hypothetical protein R3E53_08655 [Myxococcota bacterium]
MTFMPLVTTLVVTLIEVAAIARFEIDEAVAADGVVPMLLADWGARGGPGTAAALVVFVGALSAIMSTADSLLSLGSLLFRATCSGARELPMRARRPSANGSRPCCSSR